MNHVKKSASWKMSGPRRRRIRKLVNSGKCARAYKAYYTLPDSVRYDDRLGPLKAAINRCGK